MGQGVTGDLILTSVRSQVEILARKSRLEVKDLSSNAFASSSIPTAIVKAFDVLGGSIHTLGLNYQFEVPLQEIPAGTFLAQRFLSEEILAVGEPLTLMTLTFKFTTGAVNFQFQIQPKAMQSDNFSLFLNANITELISENSHFDDVEWLQQRFAEGWEQTKAATKNLLSGENDD